MSVDRGERLDVAVVGSGISGLSCAWLLSQCHRVTLYERELRPGGHTNTIQVGDDGRGETSAAALPIDTGFIVYNEATYPNLVALFGHLGVATQPSEMSFAVSLDDGALEYGGNDLSTLFAQRRNLMRPRFLLMLRDLLRFYRDAPRELAEGGLEGMSLGDFLRRERYGRAFRDDHLLPMAAAIWSAPRETLLDFPAVSFVRFCENHGLLQVKNRPIWRAVSGGSKSYIGPLSAPYRERLRLGTRIVGVVRDAFGVSVRDASGATARHDHVVLATHADTALALLDEPTAAERRLLGAFRYSCNSAVLHRDTALMPRRKKVWSSWNFLGRAGGDSDALCVTYWMNRLQSLQSETDYFVTLNPTQAPRDVLFETTYEHPIFDLRALAAQRELWSLQGQSQHGGKVWFCGAHFGAGFHEDGLQAGLAVAEALGGVRRPWQVEHESGRIVLPAQDLATGRLAR